MLSLKILAFLLFSCVFFISYGFSDADKESFPHFSKDGCKTCHITHNAKGLIKDPISLCQGCHPTAHSKDHKVGVKAKINKSNLPLDSNGNIVCAYTCHNMHPEKGTVFEKNLLRTDPDTLCLSCHEK